MFRLRKSALIGFLRQLIDPGLDLCGDVKLRQPLGRVGSFGCSKSLSPLFSAVDRDLTGKVGKPCSRDVQR
jgi:hypothetical protein